MADLMGHNPIPPARVKSVEERRLDVLRSMYVVGSLTREQHADAVEQVLRGEQPVDANGLPFMADPALDEGLERIEVEAEWR